MPSSRTEVLPEVARERDRTVTGLLLLIIGFVLSWIPYVDLLGGLLGLIGIILVVLGRRGYGPSHERFVVIGGATYFLVLIASFLVAIIFAGEVVDAASSSSLSAAGAALRSDLAGLFVATAVLGVVGGIGQVVLVYGLADATTRKLLWAAFAISVVLSLVILVFLLPAIDNAITQATSGTSVDLGPVNQLETTADLLGLSKVAPAVLFAWAYYRAREEAESRAAEPAGPRY